MAAQTAHVIKSVNGSDAAVFAFADYMYNQNGQNQFEVGVTQGNSTLDLQKAYAAGACVLLWTEPLAMASWHPPPSAG